MIGSLRSLRIVLVLGILGGAVRSAPADGWPVARGPSREPAPHRYDPRASKGLPRAFLDDAVACVLYAGSSYLVEKDGTIENITHEITRLNGRKGVEKLGEYRNIVYDPSYQKLTLNEARIHKADGRVVEVEPRHVHLRDVPTDYQVYDTEKQLIISFPSLEVGDTIEVKWTMRGKNPEHAGHFFNRYSFGDPSFPVALDELRVRLPKDRSLKYGTAAGKVEPIITEADGQRTYLWKAALTPRLPQDDDLPSREELRPTIVCSTFATWADVAAWKKRLRADCWKCTEDVRKMAHEVTKGMTDPTARARALTYWLRRKIRYVSSGEKHDYTPHPPATVLANRFGDCKDTSQLLAVMLRECGLHVELVTLGARDDGQILESVPSPWGTHAILLVTIDGKEHWIDTTATLTPWNYLPRDDRDRACYIVDAEGNIRLARTPPRTAADNRTEATTEVWIGADGSSRCERTTVSHGGAGISRRDDLAEVPDGERRRLMTSALQDSNSRTRLVHLSVDEKGLQDYDRPVTTHMVFEIPKHFTGSPDLEGSITDSRVWNALLTHNLDYDRDVPMELPTPFISHHRYVMHLPQAYVLEDWPRNKTIRSRWGNFTVRVKTLHSTDWPRDLEVDFTVQLEKVRVQPKDFAAYHRFHEDVARDYRVWLTLKPVRELEEAPLLESVLKWTPEDRASAAVLARLYLRHNRDDDARRVLKRARFYAPDDAALGELAVQAAGNDADEEAAQRELVRRFPGDTSYALTLGSILVRLSKQKEARALLEPLTKKGSATQRAQAHFHLARSYYRRDALKDALEHWQAAAHADAETMRTVRALMLKGQICEELDKLDDAGRAYRSALELDAQAEGPLDALVRLAVMQGKRADALHYLRRYAVVVGDDVSGLLVAAERYLSLGCYDDAFELASRARDQRFHEKAQRILGQVYLHRGDFTQAVRHLDKAELDAQVLEGLIWAHLELGQVRALGRCLEQAEKISKPSRGLTQALALARRLEQRRLALLKACPAPKGKESEWAQAIERLVCAEELRAEGKPRARVEALLEPALALGSDLGPALALRGRLALDQGKLSKALADAERAIKASPEEAGGYHVRGRVRLERGAADALADLEKAVTLNGRQDAEMLHNLATALARAGRNRDALVVQREAVKLRPGDAEMTEQLKTLEKAAGS